MTEPTHFTFPDDLANREEPTVAVWNRLEGRPRTTDFGRALRAEVRDPLWLLTRQWQLGEFRGTDGGSPVTATYAVSAAGPSMFRPDGGTAIALPDGQPLESVAERRALPFDFGADPISFDLRLAIGRRWLKLIRDLLVDQLLNRFRQQYIALYPIALPPSGWSTGSPSARPCLAARRRPLPHKSIRAAGWTGTRSRWTGAHRSARPRRRKRCTARCSPRPSGTPGCRCPGGRRWRTAGPTSPRSARTAPTWPG